jgi:alpha-ketoglutarate-dependent taurine dioxygenase
MRPNTRALSWKSRKPVAPDRRRAWSRIGCRYTSRAGAVDRHRPATRCSETLSMNLNTQSLHEQSAIEVQGVDLGALDNDALAAIRSTWQSYPLVLFRKQFLSEKDLVELARSFGVLYVPDRSNQATPRLDGVMYISNLKTEGGERLGGLGSAELDWHTDQSYRERPATGSIFYAVEMPSGVGRIQWCNTQLAYDALPPNQKGDALLFRCTGTTTPVQNGRAKSRSFLEHAVSVCSKLHIRSPPSRPARHARWGRRSR